MDKKTAEIMKSLIDNFIEREEVLRGLLDDSQKKVKELEVELDRVTQ